MILPTTRPPGQASPARTSAARPRPGGLRQDTAGRTGASAELFARPFARRRQSVIERSLVGQARSGKLSFVWRHRFSALQTSAMFNHRIHFVGIFTALTVISIVPALAAPLSPRDQVWAAEIAFAKSMADRDLKGFGQFVSDEAIFFASTTVLVGKAKVIEGWTAFFVSPSAPFSWQPDQVEVVESGTLALSTGLVRDPAGKEIARFNSIWRLEPGNIWRVIFDKGSPPSPGPK